MQGQQDVPGFIQAFAGDHRYIVDYLVEEVLQRQTEPVQNFLLQTSILDRMCAPLCDAVTAGRASQAMLDWLEHANLFVYPLDDQQHWYRYHHLFADLLQHRLQQTQSAGVPNLHRRASAWYESQHQWPAAVDHALAAGDLERAAHLMARSSPPIDPVALTGRPALTLPDSAAPPVLIEPLSDRELEVLRLLVADLSSTAIAAQLCISVNTARSHIRHVYDKLNVHSRYETMIRARELHLV
jgi:ATP/maltotriose-dependent transcriptional regulator MalT